MSLATMPPTIQYCLVGVLFLISAAVMLVSGSVGIHSKLDILVVIFSAISFFVAGDQFRRAFLAWHATRMKSTTTDDA